MKTPWLFALLFAILLSAKLCHVGVLWAEEDLPLAAAKQMLMGKVLYREAWFDKPPLVPAIYLLWGARIGWILRLASSLYALLAAWFAYRFAMDLWSRAEGLWAASLLTFFLIFDTPSAALPMAADLLMLAPHIAAIWLAWKKRPLLSGIACGIAFLFNAKAAFVLAACAVFCFPQVSLLAVGFAIPCGIAAIWLGATGALPFYIDSVWIWSSLYAGSSHVPNPFGNAALRTINWLGFHVALLIASAAWWFRREPIRLKMLVWALISFLGVSLGWRFFPRYFFQLIPVLVIVASRGFVLLGRKRLIALAFLLIPVIRFGPRYPMLALGMQPDWSDLAMDRDSREASALVRAQSRPGDSLFVWGYRPEMFVYTGLPAATRYLDCQALTGVPADRHLTQSNPVTTRGLAEARAALTQSRPDFIVDGLSPYNPRLAMSTFPEMHVWLTRYREIARTKYSVIYRHIPPDQP